MMVTLCRPVLNLILAARSSRRSCGSAISMRTMFCSRARFRNRAISERETPSWAAISCCERFSL
jgi:hypothetical protein